MLSILSLLGVAGNALAGVGKWLISNPLVLAALIFLGCFAITVVHKNHEIDALTAQINDPKKGWIARYNASEANNATLVKNNATLRKTLVTQSASIDALAVQGRAASDKYDQLISAQASSRAKDAQTMAALTAAKAGADKCQSASDLIRSITQ